jgi:hypothetical protein
MLPFWRTAPLLLGVSSTTTTTSTGFVARCHCGFDGMFFASLIHVVFYPPTLQGFGNNGELARSAGMTKPDEYGQYDLGRPFFYRNVQITDDETGTTFTDSKPNLDLVKEHFLKPQPVQWATSCTNPALKRTVIAVGLGFFHILVAARDPGQFEAKLYTSGLNNFGQLGHGDDNISRHALTLVRFFHTHCPDYRNEIPFCHSMLFVYYCFILLLVFLVMLIR